MIQRKKERGRQERECRYVGTCKCMCGWVQVWVCMLACVSKIAYELVTGALCVTNHQSFLRAISLSTSFGGAWTTTATTATTKTTTVAATTTTTAGTTTTTTAATKRPKNGLGVKPEVEGQPTRKKAPTHFPV